MSLLGQPQGMIERRKGKRPSLSFALQQGWSSREGSKLRVRSQIAESEGKTVRKDTPPGPLRVCLETDRRVFMEAPQVIHLGLTLTTRLSMVPAWLESWWSTPPPEAWDITHANSFYRANPTAMLMWIFTAWRHDVILGLLVFAVFTGVLVFAFLLI